MKKWYKYYYDYFDDAVRASNALDELGWGYSITKCLDSADNLTFVLKFWDNIYQDKHLDK